MEEKQFDFSGLNLTIPETQPAGQAPVTPTVPVQTQVQPQVQPQPQVQVQPTTAAPLPQAPQQSAPVVNPQFQAPQSSAPVNQPQPQAQQPFPIADDGDGIALGTIDFGKTLFSYKFDRFRPVAGTYRLGFLTDKAFKAETHYVQAEGLKGFICFHGDCCKNEGEPTVRALLPVLVYEINRSGQLVAQTSDLKVLALGNQDYNKLLNAYQLAGKSFTKSDVILTASPKGNFFDLSFNIASPISAEHPCAIAYMKDAQSHISYLKENINYLYQAAGRKITAEFYAQRKAQAAGNLNYSSNHYVGDGNPSPTDIGHAIDIADLPF